MKRNSIFFQDTGFEPELSLRNTYDLISRHDDDPEFDEDEDDFDGEDFDEEKDFEEDDEPEMDTPGSSGGLEREPNPQKDREQQQYDTPHPDISKDQPKAS